jgi:hypothetical protein
MAAVTVADNDTFLIPNPAVAAAKIIGFVALMAVLLIGLPLAGAAGLYALFA